MSYRTIHIALWLMATSLAIFLALLVSPAAFVDGEYIPVGNDSFYHARRILDAAIGERGFYQFDNMIHAPEGSWLNWPWGYDYLMAVALSIALWLRPGLEPMAFLAHVPVAWLFVNMGLVALIGQRMGLRTGTNAAALLAFALLPLTQTLHGVGIIDHHFIELTFVLAAVWAGLRFFSAAHRWQDAVLLGFILGIAPAFHNSLFILQIPLLLCLLIHWFHGLLIDKRGISIFAWSLLGSTLLFSLPSAAFRAMQFEFWTLSWFHLYIAACSAICAVFLSLRTYQKRNLLIFLALTGVLLIPLVTRVMIGAAFLSGELIVLDLITEVRSPLRTITEPGGLAQITGFYSLLFYLAPVLIAVFAGRAWRHREPGTIYLSVFVIFGLLLLFTQFRLHPFGSWALVLGSLLLVQELAERSRASSAMVTAASLLMVALAFQPSLKNRLFEVYAPGNSVDYAASRGLFPGFAEHCAEDTGIALSYNNDGHYIRYHTDCSVISNNFLMTPLHEQKILEANRLLRLNPEQLLLAAPELKYVFVRMIGIFDPGPDKTPSPTPIPVVIKRNVPLFVALTFAAELPAEYVLVDEVRVLDERDFAYARVFKIVRDE